MFVPKGYIPLKEAIDCLARARGAAGLNPATTLPPPPTQRKNLEPTKVAHEQLQADLHSGSIRAVVIWPVTGRMLEILPDNWALEAATTWIEEGELLMRSDRGMQLVGVSLGGFLGTSHRVTIFVRIDDLRRLIEEITSVTNNAALSIRRGGRPREYDFDSARELVRATVQQAGLPSPTNRRLPSIKQLVELVVDHMDKKDQYPSPSLVRQRVNEWLEEISKNPQK